MPKFSYNVVPTLTDFLEENQISTDDVEITITFKKMTPYAQFSYILNKELEAISGFTVDIRHSFKLFGVTFTIKGPTNDAQRT